MSEKNLEKAPHYNAHPSGIECGTIIEHMTFWPASAIKYLWRSGIKTEDPLEDLRKAKVCIEREIERLSKLVEPKVFDNDFDNPNWVIRFIGQDPESPVTVKTPYTMDSNPSFTISQARQYLTETAPQYAEHFEVLDVYLEE